MTQGGILVGVIGIIIAQVGFSDSCSVEVVDKLIPLIGALPGLVTAWIGRWRQGDVSPIGFKKN